VRPPENSARCARRAGIFAHDIDTSRGNRDHIAVGPSRVYLIDSKKPGGTVTVLFIAAPIAGIVHPLHAHDIALHDEHKR